MATNDVQSYLNRFAGLTNNEVYYHAFHNLAMKRLQDAGQFEFWCNTQRQQFASALKRALASLPDGAHIWDTGGGAGSVIPLLSTLENATVHIVEPNRHLLEVSVGSVQETASVSASLSLGKVHDGPLQDFYTESPTVEESAPPLVDMALFVHVINFLVDIYGDDMDPEASIVKGIGCIYQRLRRNGRIFLVYSAAGNLGELVALHAFQSVFREKPYARNLERFLASEVSLFENGVIKKHLDDMFPDCVATVDVEHQACHFFAESELDLAAIGLIRQVPVNDQPFDLKLLESNCNFLSQHGADNGLEVETANVPQHGAWKVNAGQVVVVITKR